MSRTGRPTAAVQIWRVIGCLVALSSAVPAQEAGYPLTAATIRIRDPFILPDPDTRIYYLYAQTGNRDGGLGEGVGVEVYASRDLAHWSAPRLVFRLADQAGFWGKRPIWAPEVHRFASGEYGLFVTFTGREGGRGTQILVAERPTGPFQVRSTEASTPPAERALDGTAFVDAQGQNWLVYCHEWEQIADGAIRAVRMASDWSRREGTPILLFHASQAPWVRTWDGKPDRFVTDGPFLHRTADGTLLLIWSSFSGRNGKDYALGVARSESGTLAGPWRHEPEPLVAADGGHGMLFRTFEGQLTLAIHQPNHGKRERLVLLPVVEQGGRLRIEAPAAAP